jgi:hypothetical protein
VTARENHNICGLEHDPTYMSCFTAALMAFGVCDCLRTRGDNEGFTVRLFPHHAIWAHADCGRPTYMFLKSQFDDAVQTTEGAAT